MGAHKDSTEIHIPFAFVYADSTARLAATGFVPADVNKIVLQLSDASVWILTDDSPITWSQMGGAPYTDEQAQDAVGGMIADTDTLDLTYTDATPELKGDVKKQMSITSDSSGLKLSGDSATPGNNKVYGTDGSGAKGWKADPAGGGGLTHSYLGYNTVGGSLEAMIQRRVYAKKITVATAGILTSIGANVIDHSSDQVVSLSCALFSDNAGTPDQILGYIRQPTQSFLPDNTNGGGGNTARWLELPCGVYVPAADYWVAVMSLESGLLDIAYDGSGSDRYYTSGGDWFADWGWYSPTTSSNKYSIRASIIS